MKLDRWMLEMLAPDDVEVALEDLRVERERKRSRGVGRLRAAVGYWVQLLGIGLYGVRDRMAANAGPGGRPRLRPWTAFRLAVRGLAKRPGTALTAVPTLGVGLGAAVGLLGVVHGMFRPLPVPGGEDVVRIELRDERARPVAPPPGLLDVAERSGGALEALGAFRVIEADLRDAEGHQVRRSAARMDPEVFALLRTPPARGRVFAERESAVVVVGHDLWQDLLEGRSGVVGSTLRVDGAPHTVVGVMPEGFGFPFNQSLWLPPIRDAAGAVSGLAGAELVGRLAPGASRERASAELEASLSGLPGAGEPGSATRAEVGPYVGGRGEGAENVALAGLGVLVAMLLVVAAANVSTLLLVRAVERADTLAIHAALGASRLQVALQLFLEALLVAAVGGVVGLAFGRALLGWIEANLSVHWGYYWMRMELRPAVVGWTVLLVFGVAALAGTTPALRAMRIDLQSALKTGASGSASRRLGGWFSGVQVALSTVALVVAAFLGMGVLRSFDSAARLPLDQVTVGQVRADSAAVPDAGARRALVADFSTALAESFAGAPVSLSTGMPLFGGSPVTLDVPGVVLEEDRKRAVWIGATPGYFDVYGLPLRRGRAFSASDVASAPAVALVNESFVRRFLDGRDPLGLPVELRGVAGVKGPVTVVGVVADALSGRPGSRGDRLYLPLGQVDVAGFMVSVRGVDPATAAEGLRAVAESVHGAPPVQEVRSLRDFVAWLTRLPRTLGVLGALGGLAGVLVASIGLYGLLAFQVRTRFREIGVRMALGARSRGILFEILVTGLRRMAPGLAVGMGVGALLGPLLNAFLVGLGPSLVAVYGGVLATMVVVGLLASLTPALRASRLDPLSVLRSE